MMKVSLVRITFEFYPKSGGSVTHIIELSRKIDGHLDGQTIIAPAYGGDYSEFDRAFGIPVTRVNYRKFAQAGIRRVPRSALHPAILRLPRGRAPQEARRGRQDGHRLRLRRHARRLRHPLRPAQQDTRPDHRLPGRRHHEPVDPEALPDHQAGPRAHLPHPARPRHHHRRRHPSRPLRGQPWKSGRYPTIPSTLPWTRTFSG